MANPRNNLRPLMLEKKATLLVKPSQPSPSETLSFSTLDNDSFNDVFYRSFAVYQSNDDMTVLKDPESVIKQACSDVLVYYYPLAGKLKRRSSDDTFELSCTADGVPFISATADCELSSINYLATADTETTSLLAPDSDVTQEDNENDDGFHPLALQVTRFLCGGFTIGWASSHVVFDGFGIAHFYRALTELASGKSEPTVKPIWERHRLVGKPDERPAKVPGSHGRLFATSPYLPTTDLVREIIKVSPDSIKLLKERLTKESLTANSEFSNQSLTTFEVLGAYIWRSRFRALNLNPDGITVFGLSVSIRRVLDPPLPDGYYGNAYIDMYLELTGRELEESPLSNTVKLIKRVKKTASDKDYLWEELGNSEKLRKLNVSFTGRKDGMVFVTDMRNLGWSGSVDFGWKETVNLVHVVPLENAKNLCMFLPPSKFDPPYEEGGVRVVMALPRAAMAKFKEEMDALNKLGDDVAVA